MKLIRQIASDVRKELHWLLFYGILTAAVLSALILISQSYRHVALQSSAIEPFTAQQITITRMLGAPYDAPLSLVQQPDRVAAAESLASYYQKAFSPQGNAGSYVIMPARLGYRQVILLLGIYADLTPYGDTDDDCVTFAVSHDLQHVAEDTITVNGTVYPLAIAPENMSINHPMLHLTTESGYLHDTLFVFSKRYADIQKLFPASTYWELRESSLLSWLILRHPSEEDIIHLRSVVSKNTGGFVGIQTMEEYLRSTTITGVRTHQTYLLFYFTAAASLSIAMLVSLYKIFQQRCPEYVTHYLFGASRRFIFCRMLGLSICYHILPVFWTIHIMLINRLATAVSISILFFIVLTAMLLTIVIAYRLCFVQQIYCARRDSSCLHL